MTTSPTPILYGFSVSPHVRAIRIALAEKGIAHDYKEIGLPDLATEAYARINPFRLMPAMTVSEGALYETPALLTWADLSGDGARLQPQGAFDVARMWTLIGVAQNPLYKIGVMQLYFHRMLAGNFGVTPDPKVAEQAVAPTLVALDVVEDMLSDGWLSGGAFSLADIYCGAMIDYIALTEDGRDALATRPKTRAWIDALRARTSFSTTFPSLLKTRDQA